MENNAYTIVLSREEISILMKALSAYAEARQSKESKELLLKIDCAVPLVRKDG
jgi:hypothetical protein